MFNGAALIGMPAAQAEKLLLEQGITVKLERTGRDDTGEDRVIRARQITRGEACLTVAFFKLPTEGV